MSIVLKRPMFRKGGAVADKASGLSGLSNRKHFADGELATNAALGDYDLSRLENIDFGSDDSSDFDDYLLADALKNNDIATDDTDISTGISPTTSIDSNISMPSFMGTANAAEPTMKQVFEDARKGALQKIMPAGSDYVDTGCGPTPGVNNSSYNMYGTGEEMPISTQAAITNTGEKTPSSKIFPGEDNTQATADGKMTQATGGEETKPTIVNPYVKQSNKQSATDIYDEILKRGLITPEEHRDNAIAAFAAAQGGRWATVAPSAARNLLEIEAPQKTAAQKYASLAAIKDIANKTVNPTILQNKALAWARLNQLDSTFKDLPADQQEQAVLAYMQKWNEEKILSTLQTKPENPENLKQKEINQLIKNKTQNADWNEQQSQNAVPFWLAEKSGVLTDKLGNPDNPYVKEPNKYVSSNGKLVYNDPDPNKVQKKYKDYIPNKDYYLKSEDGGKAGLYTFTGDGFIKSDNNSKLNQFKTRTMQ